jgi:hypothetical protein
MAKPIKGITRIDYEGLATRGWMVRITRAGNRKQQFFNDKTHGGKAKALAAAKAQYDVWYVEAGPIVGNRGKKSVRNSSGVVGVHLVKNVDARWTNAESYAYCASWVSPQGERRKVSFAWNRYGKKASWELAKLAREKLNNNRDEIVMLYEKMIGKKLRVRAAKKAK